MTLIQPGKNFGYLYVVLMVLTFPLITGVIWLVLIYNQTVDVRHGISDTKSELQRLEIQNAEYKEKLFKVLDTASLLQIAKTNSFEQDTKPRYLEVSKDNQWALASHL